MKKGAEVLSAIGMKGASTLVDKGHKANKPQGTHADSKKKLSHKTKRKSASIYRGMCRSFTVNTSRRLVRTHRLDLLGFTEDNENIRKPEILAFAKVVVLLGVHLKLTWALLLAYGEPCLAPWYPAADHGALGSTFYIYPRAEEDCTIITSGSWGGVCILYQNTWR